MSSPSPSDLAQQLIGLPIWFVNCGGAAGSSFSLALGGKVRRSSPLKNPSVSQEFRDQTGAANLYVWCSWRLMVGERLASSDQDAAVFQSVLQALMGSVVQSVAVMEPFQDLELITDAGQLQLFCDHVPPKMSYRLNWELTVPTATLVVGPGVKVEVEGPAQP
ncbi:MAG: hypothetical protein RL033_2309 [Pseudomonadota bacterium]